MTRIRGVCECGEEFPVPRIIAWSRILSVRYLERRIARHVWDCPVERHEESSWTVESEVVVDG